MVEWLYSIQDAFVRAFETGTTILIIIGSAAGIIFTIIYSIIVMQKQKFSNEIIITVSTVICCILMIPLISALNLYVQNKVTGNVVSEAKKEIRILREEDRRIRNENRVKELEIIIQDLDIALAQNEWEYAELKIKHEVLEQAKSRIQGFRNIMELALMQAQLKNTLVRIEPVTPLRRGLGINADIYQDEVLVISPYNFNAKFGVDLNDVKVTKNNENTVTVSGIKPKFIGVDKYEFTNMVREIRRVDYKYKVRIKEVIQKDRQHSILANNKADEYRKDFEKTIGNNLDFAFMNDIIIQLAQNFVQIVLYPINVLFDETEQPKALSLFDYISSEYNEIEKEISNNKSNENKIRIKIIMEHDNLNELKHELSRNTQEI